MVYTVARAPLRFQIDQSGMADQALVPGSGGLQPIRQMSSITRAAGSLAASIDKRKLTNGLVGGLVDLLTRAGQRITHNVLRELFAESSRACVVRQQDHVSGRCQQMIVPAREEV